MLVHKRNMVVIKTHLVVIITKKVILMGAMEVNLEVWIKMMMKMNGNLSSIKRKRVVLGGMMTINKNKSQKSKRKNLRWLMTFGRSHGKMKINKINLRKSKNLKKS